nr:hypothetical protein [Planctomycetota bacterium]
VKRCERIFASPHDPFRIWVCTAQGIMETRDDGVQWRLMPGTARDQVGRIEDVSFAPAQAGVILLGSRDKGVLRSDDDGATWRTIGTIESGLAALQIVRLGTSPSDRSGRIWYAAHGDAAPGVSKSIDGGATWFTISPQLYAEDLLLDGQEILITAHSTKEQDLWSVYKSDDCGGSWLEALRDVKPTATGTSRSTLGSLWLGALKGRLLHRLPSGAHKRTAPWSPVGPQEGTWASIFGTTRGADELMFAYDPRTLGLLASKDGFATWWAENDGLFVARLVKDGANVCASANGRSFYASINGQLYIGRTPTQPGPLLTSFAVDPAIVTVTGTGKVRFTVRVQPADETPDAKIAAIQVRSGALNLPLLDDGAHDDGAAGDGLFAGSVEAKEDFLQGNFKAEDRWNIPGQVLMDVVAVDTKNRLTVEKLPFSFRAKPQQMIFWDGEAVNWGGRMANARRGAPQGKFDSRSGIIFDIDAEAHGGARCLHVVAWRGPWLTGWGLDYYGKNLSDMDHLVFWIKASSRTTRDLQVLLTDAPGHENDARQSQAVWLIKDGFLTELTESYQRVRIPVARLVTRTGFDLTLCNGIAFGGADANGHNVFVDDIAFENGPPQP